MKTFNIVFVFFCILAYHCFECNAFDESKIALGQPLTIPGDPRQLIYAGNKSEIVFIISNGGSIFRSSDEGMSWKDITANLTDSKNVSMGWIYVSRANPYYIFFNGNNGEHYRSRDGAVTVERLVTGIYINRFEFHPTQPEWVLAGQYSKQCRPPRNIGCNYEVYMSKEFATELRPLEQYVVPGYFSWNRANIRGVDKNSIYACLHTKLRSGDQNFYGWSSEVAFVHTVDYFYSRTNVLPGGNAFLYAGNYLFIGTLDVNRTVNLWVSKDGTSFTKCRFPGAANETGYAFMDARNVQFLVLHDPPNEAEIDDLYTGDATAANYTLSLRNGHSTFTYGWRYDFKPVWSVEGIYLANIVSNAELKKEHTSILAQIQTKISFDNGARWQFITAPKQAFDHKPYCTSPDVPCNLHLNGETQYQINNVLSPVYATETASGLILGTGNVGQQLDINITNINTYFSRDGGVTFEEILQGPHMYEYGDYGAIIIFTPTYKTTNYITYTVDQGLTLRTFNFSSNLTSVVNLVNDPDSKGAKFLIQSRLNGKTTFYPIDFSTIYSRECDEKNPCKIPDDKACNSDYEYWNPKNKDCLLGREVQYMRRVRSKDCYNGKGWPDKVDIIDICLCTADDYECDYGYQRNNTEDGTGPCVSLNNATKTPTAPFPSCGPIPAGYRKIVSDSCTIKECSDGGLSVATKVILGIFTTLLLGGGIVAVILYARNKGFFKRNTTRYSLVGADEANFDEDNELDAEPLKDNDIVLESKNEKDKNKEEKEETGTIELQT